MSILSGIKKVIPYYKNSDGNYEQLSYKTSSNTVEFDDEQTAQTKVGAIKGITTSTSVTEEGYAADAKTVSQISQSLGRLSDVVISRHHSDSNKYYDFYYDKGAGYLGCIYNLGSNGINGIRPTLFTLRTSYDGTQIQFNQLTDAPNATINITKAANNKYVTLSITDSVQKTNLSYLNVWMCKVS